MLATRGSLATSDQKTNVGTRLLSIQKYFVSLLKVQSTCFCPFKDLACHNHLYMQIYKKIFPLPSLTIILPINPVRVLHVEISE